MNWFDGEIAQAITTSKAQNAIFVVYVYGKDDKSAQITELINKDEIAKILGSPSFVAIKIEAETVPYQQFSEIYKQVPVPSIYFIGKQGVPLEIVTEANDVKIFQKMLNSVLEKGGLAPMAVQTQEFVSKEQTAAKSEDVACENGVCTIKQDKPSTSEDTEVEVSKTPPKPELSPEEKVERAKQLVEQKREEKRKEEEERERQKELERRKMGQSVQQLKRWQDDEELKHVLEEREKEKRESQAARDRVLAQIAQDKAERAAKFSPPTTSQQPQPQASARPANINTARLQFRMPDGRTATNDFSSGETLESVHAHIKANLSLPFSTYTLSTTFPRREFTDQDRSTSLLELGLAPTAVVLILPLNRGAVSTNPQGGIGAMFWSLLMPILSLFDYLKSFVFGTPAPSSNDSSNKRSAEPAQETKVPPKVRRAGESTVVRRQGNVHRLSDRNDSDDENNTWNGNSTQQM